MGTIIQLPLQQKISPTDTECVLAYTHLQEAILLHWEQKSQHSEWKLRKAMTLYMAVVRK